MRTPYVSEVHRQRCRNLAAVIIPYIRDTARCYGYAIGVHGSLERDIDLIAAPWRDDAVSAEDLFQKIREQVKILNELVEIENDQVPEAKPHGRLAWSIHLEGGPYIDLSVLPKGGSNVTQKEDCNSDPVSCGEGHQ